MAFDEFQFPGVIDRLGLRLSPAEDMFKDLKPAACSPALRETLTRTARLAITINTEKARSEWMVAPVLGEFWSWYHAQIGLYSGVDFPAEPDSGLTGVVDFILGKSPQVPHVVAPVAVIFEAKRDNLNDGLGQCIAAMVGAWRFNLREGNDIPIVYGGVTTGSLWKFLKLVESDVTLDMREYSLNEVDRILGILVHMVGSLPPAAAA